MGKPSDTAVDGLLAGCLENFAEITALLRDSELFSGCAFEQKHVGSACISDDETSIWFVGREVWGSPAKLERLETKSKDAAFTFFYVVSEEDYPNLPVELLTPVYSKIITPISVHNFHEIVSTAQFSQRDIRTAMREQVQTNKDVTDVKRVLSMSRQLNGVRDVPKLLHLILEKAREITNADAGSIYEVELPTDNVLDGTIHFRFTQNYSVKQDLSTFSIPVDDSSVVGSCVMREEPINVDDLYKLARNGKQTPAIRGLQHNKSFDQKLNYRSHSMLTTPIFDISRQVIGVIQLLNRKRDFDANLLTPKDFEQQVVPFNAKDIEHVEIVAQQSGIALENARLHGEIQDLFDGFVDASITIIEQRDPTTSGHSHRVAAMTMDLARIVNDIDEGEFIRTRFSDAQMKELHYAALLHDFGKLGVSENVLVKAKKLYPWQMDNLLGRFELIRASYETEYLNKMLALHKEGEATVEDIRDKIYLRDRDKKLAELEDCLEFIIKNNEPTVTTGRSAKERIQDIGNRTFTDIHGNEQRFLSEVYMDSLSVTKGSLTADEFYQIQGHVTHTYEFLKKIPWSKGLANIPDIAAKHHEKLDGSGYPNKVSANAIPVQSRIMTIADIFDALTAADRPYKKSISPDNALHIMGDEVKQGKLDADLFELFVESKNYLQIIQKVD